MLKRFRRWLQDLAAAPQRPAHKAEQDPTERYQAMASELGTLALEWADACNLAEGQMTQMTIWGMECREHGTKMPNLVLTLSAHPHTVGAPMAAGETLQ